MLHLGKDGSPSSNQAIMSQARPSSVVFQSRPKNAPPPSAASSTPRSLATLCQPSSSPGMKNRCTSERAMVMRVGDDTRGVSFNPSLWSTTSKSRPCIWYKSQSNAPSADTGKNHGNPTIRPHPASCGGCSCTPQQLKGAGKRMLPVTHAAEYFLKTFEKNENLPRR